MDLQTNPLLQLWVQLNLQFDFIHTYTHVQNTSCYYVTCNTHLLTAVIFRGWLLFLFGDADTMFGRYIMVFEMFPLLQRCIFHKIAEGYMWCLTCNVNWDKENWLSSLIGFKIEVVQASTQAPAFKKQIFTNIEMWNQTNMWAQTAFV